MKKSAEVSEFPEEVRLEHEKNTQKEQFERKNGLLGKIKFDDVKHFLWLILEWMIKGSRSVFLKIGSQFDSWGQYIRNKKANRANKGRKNQEVFVPEKDSDIMDKLANYEFKNVEEPRFVRQAVTPEPENVIEEEIRPIANRKAVGTKKPVEIKDRLEELLIERIAINPKDTEAYERLGEYYLEIESWTDAKECFKQVIKLDPKNRNAKYRIRRLETILTAR